ncbi:MAG: hypothetical protein WCC36_03570 [Gammaproteobacteria bacterium]
MAVLLARIMGRVGARCALALAASAVPGWVCPAAAGPVGPHPFAGLTAVSEQDLAERRGGFDFAGMKFEFGAQVRTVIDGQLALQSTFTVNDSGQLSGQQVIGGAGRPVDAATAARLAAAGLKGADLAGVAAGGGVIVQDAKGTTLAVHDISQSRVIGLLVNTASDRQIQQQLNITVGVARFKEFQQAVRDTLLSNRIGLQSGQLP